MRLRATCPAKVNLFLAVGPRDPSGYHPIRSVFQTIDLCDTLEVEPTGGRDELIADVDWIPPENTLTRACRLLREVLPLPPVRMRLTKRIPAESGLGGGSSDAAALIRAACAIAGSAGSEAELRSVAAAVGADVPFFLVGGAARVEGYGEVVRALPDPPPTWFVVARPPVGCPTGAMYARLDESPAPWREFPVGDDLYNDFSRVAPLETSALVARLLSLGARDAQIAGSGSCAFGRFPDEESARRAADGLRGDPWPRTWVARSLCRSEATALAQIG